MVNGRAQLGIGEVAGVGEMSPGGADDQLRQGHDTGTGEDEDVAQLRLGTGSRASSRAGSHDDDRLVMEGTGGSRARGPDGADSAAARINPGFSDACRRLPAKPTILIWSIEVLSIVFLPTRAGRAELESPAFGRGSGVG